MTFVTGTVPHAGSQHVLPVFMAFPSGSDGKESACNVEDPGLIPGSGRSSGEGNGYPLAGEFHGQSCLAGYSP